MLVHETWWSKTKEKERLWSVKMVGSQGLIGLQPTVTRLSSTTLSSKTNHESLLNICSPKVRTRDPKLMMSAWKLWVVFFHLPLSINQIFFFININLWLKRFDWKVEDGSKPSAYTYSGSEENQPVKGRESRRVQPSTFGWGPGKGSSVWLIFIRRMVNPCLDQVE